MKPNPDRVTQIEDAIASTAAMHPDGTRLAVVTDRATWLEMREDALEQRRQMHAAVGIPDPYTEREVRAMPTAFNGLPLVWRACVPPGTVYVMRWLDVPAA